MTLKRKSCRGLSGKYPWILSDFWHPLFLDLDLFEKPCKESRLYEKVDGNSIIQESFKEFRSEKQMT